MLSQVIKQLPWHGLPTQVLRKIAFMYLLLVIPAIGYIIGSSAINAMLIKRLGIQYLPYSYIILSIFNMCGTFFFLLYADKLIRVRLLVIFAACSGVILLLSRLLAPSVPVGEGEFSWNILAFFILLFIIHGFFTMALNTQSWSILNDLFRPSLRIRLLPLFATAWTTGGVIGGLILRLLVPVVGVVNIIPFWGIMFLGIIPLAYKFQKMYGGEMRWKPPLVSADKKPPQLDQLKEVMQYIAVSPIVWYIVAMPLLYNITNGFQDFQFNQVMNETYPTETALGAFFGTFSVISSLAAFVLQLTLASKALHWTGIFRSLFALPSVTLIAFVFLLIHFGFWEGVWLRLGWAIIASTLYFNALQLTYAVIPFNYRGRVRSFNGGIVNSIGTIGGAVVLILLQIFLEKGTTQQYLFPTLGGIVFCLIWIYIVMKGRGVYIQTLIDNLHQKDYNTRLEALESMEERREPAIHRTLNAILLNNDETSTVEIKSKAMKVLSLLGDSDSLRTLSLFLNDPDPELRLNAIMAISYFKKLSKHPFAIYYLTSKIQEIFKHDTSHPVRVEAGRFLLNFLPKDQQPKFFEEILNHPDLNIRMMGIKNIDLLNVELVDMLAISKLKDADPTVRTEAIMALWKFSNYRGITGEALRGLLQSQNPEEVECGLIALMRIGGPSEHLKDIEPLIDAKSHLIRSLTCVFILSSLPPGSEGWIKAQNVLMDTLSDPNYPQEERKEFITFIPNFKDEAVDGILEGLQNLSTEKRAVATAGIENFAELLYNKIINES